MSRATRRRPPGRSASATLDRSRADAPSAAEPATSEQAAAPPAVPRAAEEQQPARRVAPPRAEQEQEEARGPYGPMPRIRWKAVLVGVVLGQLILLLITNGGIDLANYFFGGTGDNADGGIVGVASFVAVIAGGAIAARVAGAAGWRESSFQGIVVAIGFIVIAILFQLAQEASLVHDSLTMSGPRNLVDLGPMRIDQVITGDLLALTGGFIGGFLARRTT